MPIRILDSQIVGRIAAGEVVERPTSAMKELVENSIDAGATAITVEIKDGGLTYLRVTDNGAGIPPNQVRLAFENHATSKISSVEQLDDIRTLGFRGEALPSIAAVSRIEMNTRTRDEEYGIKLSVEGGKDMRVAEYGCPEGTTIIMRDIFFNLPVRKAFMKKPAYEATLINEAIAKMILGNPQISFRFINNGKTVYHSFGDGSLKNAVFATYGKEALNGMLEIDGAMGGMRIYGMVGIGDLAKSTRAYQSFFINGRLIKCNLLTQALEKATRERVMKGTYPMCVLNVVLPYNSVDINVHPNKLEVRFKDEELFKSTAEELLSRAFDGEKILKFNENRPMLDKVTTIEFFKPEDIPVNETEVCNVQTKVDNKQTVVDNKHTKVANKQTDVAKDNDFEAMIERERKRVSSVSGSRSVSERIVTPVFQDKQAETESLIDESIEPIAYRLIGVLFNTYILIEAQNSLYMIDQHAAHERLRYEEYLKKMGEGAASQQLLTPLIIRLSPREISKIEDNIAAFETAGYDVEVFGDRDLKVRAVPFVLGEAVLKPVFTDVIDELSSLKGASLDERRAAIMQMSCKGAVKGGDILSDSEISILVDSMLKTGASPTCPHGRPVMRSLSKREIERMFKRVQ